MALWNPPSIKEEPQVLLTHWRAIEVNGNHHVCGMNPYSDESRVSSAIVIFDPITHTLTTSSGRKYTLSGPASNHAEVEYVVKGWKSKYNIPDNAVKVITSFYQTLMRLESPGNEL